MSPSFKPALSCLIRPELWRDWRHGVKRPARNVLSCWCFPRRMSAATPKVSTLERVGSRTAAGRDEYLRYARAAIAVPGPETARIGKLAAAMGGHLVVGVIEKAGGTLYCTALY